MTVESTISAESVTQWNSSVIVTGQNVLDFFIVKSLLVPESLDIERRHMAALTWDAMFRSRRAAILADGGLFDSVAVWSPAEVGCSVPLLTLVIRRVCRKSGISSVFGKNNLWLFIEKKMNDLVGTRPI